jgi:hypothetical protein
MTMKAKRTSIRKKEEVSARIEKLDPNNNKNIPENPLIIKREKEVHDDNFEHRVSGELIP